jgi:FkbH-like protein
MTVHGEPESAPAGQPVRVAVLGSSNVRVLRSAFAGEIPAWLPERPIETYDVPYGQLRQALVDRDSALRHFQPHFAIFCDRLEDLVAQSRLDGLAQEVMAELVTEYGDLVAAFHRANGGWSIVHRFATLSRPADEREGQGTGLLAEQMNGLLSERLAGLPQLLFLDVAAEAASEPNRAMDPMLWHLARLPYSEPFSKRLARRWIGKISSALGKTARLIVLDLDNTLWGGILGEEGLAGVRIGGEYPGNAFVTFQQALKALSRRGVALAVCSKNDERLAIEALDTLPGMQIHTADLVSYRINWRPKWSNVQEIADELNLGLESLLYIDDDAVEREAIRHQLPGVKILDLPESPALFADALVDSPWLDAAAVTDEDRRRVDSYKALRRVKQERVTAGNLDDFYAGLGMKLHFRPLDEANVARAAQLSQKTNQFNTTTRRYGQGDLRRIVEQGGEVVVVGLEDRYTQFENIGLVVLKPDSAGNGHGCVDNYLLSCRVLGRGLEGAVLRWAVNRAALRKWPRLDGLVIETPRNAPARGVFGENGFRRGESSGYWSIETDHSLALPGWLAVIDRMPPASAPGTNEPEAR